MIAIPLVFFLILLNADTSYFVGNVSIRESLLLSNFRYIQARQPG
jgi:hypothetical protein